MKRLLALAGVAMALLMVIPVLMLILVIGSTSSVASCQSWANNQPLPGLPNSQVTIAQANIKVSLPRAAFEADLAKVLATSPDFVSLNEVSRRPDAQITPAGYNMWRAPQHGADGTAVLWRADKWTKVASGRVMMVTSGPQRWDHSRAATWATLQGSDGSKISMISVHHMINPRKYGPNKPLRRQLYRQGLEKVQQLVEDLSADGPVFLAGDLNYQFAHNDAWGPRTMLGAVGMKSSMDVLGRAPTHDGGGIIDYQFFQTGKAVPTVQNTTDLASDHHLLTATYSLLGTGATGQMEPVAGLTATQVSNAAQVFTTGQQMGMGERGIVIALAVASQESSFKIYANDGQGNDLRPDQRGIEASLALPHDAVGSDHGSLGIMQQQWPWWSPVMEQLMDPASASRLFYDALRNVRGWQRMEITEAAQAVQRSAHPRAYADDVPLAQRLYDHFAAGAITPGDDGPVEPIGLTPQEQEDCRDLLGLPETMSCPPTGLAVEQGLTPDALLVLRCVDQQFGRHVYGGVGDRPANPGSDHPAGRAVDVMIENYASSPAIAEGDQIAEWVRAHATELGVKYVIWRARIWNLGDAGWSTYTHPSGATDDTNLHMDHVHVSVFGNRGTGLPTSGGGSVVYPVPATMKDSNRDNWGDTGDHWGRGHTGTDFSVPCGTPVLASHSGTVSLDRTQRWAGPTLVKIAVAPRQLTTWYAHMESVTVTHGQTVAAGQQIGTVGSEGNSTGCHLHFEVHLRGGGIYDSDNTDPTPWLAANVGTTLGGGTTRVATFNVLGHSHTKPGGNRPGWPASRTRMQRAVQALNAAGIELAGLQELEPTQSRAFLNITGGTWDVYPRPGAGNTANTVAWRTDRWELVRAQRIKIPYFQGNERRMPYVLLRNLATGQQVWVASFHNPADTRGPAQQWRDEAEHRQAALARRLHRSGIPVIFTGDMNDRTDYFCDTVNNSPLRAANGGSARPCHPPANMEVDWIMGSPKVTFSAYSSDNSTKTNKISDHPLISATVTFN